MPAHAAYRAYLDRFDKSVGPLDVGAYGKWKGQLIRKLTVEEFTAREAEYRKLCEDFEKSVVEARTLSNRLIKQLRERAAELVLPPPL